MTEHDIQQLICNRFIHEKYIVPNLHLPLGEADLLLIRRSGYAEEFEIKLTNSDFNADAKKTSKHHWYQSAACLNSPYDEQRVRRYRIPNRFSYVLPELLGIVEADVPVYAGLYHVTDAKLEHEQLACIKHPPLIHKLKYKHWDAVVAASCSARYMAMRINQVHLEAKLKQLRNRIKELESIV